MARITLENLAHSYSPSPKAEADWALKPMSLTWRDGGAYALLGSSGCGKTTTLLAVAGHGDDQVVVDSDFAVHCTPGERGEEHRIGVCSGRRLALRRDDGVERLRRGRNVENVSQQSGVI